MKVMGAGLHGGTSFMEDYTYHLTPTACKCLARTCWKSVPPSHPAGRTLEIHPLGIGGKADPVRLVFNTTPGPALNASIIDLGNRFRMIVNTVEVVPPPNHCPSCRLRGHCGLRSQISRPPRRPGSVQAAHTIRGSANRLRLNICSCSRTWQISKMY